MFVKTDRMRGSDEDADDTDNVVDTEDSYNADKIRKKRQVNKARLSKKKQKIGRGKPQFQGLRHRGTPTTLRDVIKGLKPEQRKAVTEMGLGSILDFDIGAIPSKLAYYAVNSFFPKQKYFKTLGGKFTAKEKDVHNVFGLEMGGRVIVYRERSNSANTLVKDWKNQFPEAKEGQVSIKMLGERIKGMDIQDIHWFKQHVLVLFYTTLVEYHKNAICNTRILHCIDNVDDIPRLNRCEFIVRKLRDSVDDWCDMFKNSNFTGPLIFITVGVLIYNCNVTKTIYII